ncbi:rhoGAP domain-containing protein [Ditylenchus destructor]|uniref:RhoGAP domain-containing protein n=1 Tax=Ditylenchus destructor TaxID=166010 RepID=A0AAD4N8K3_9BILA|nr:rhoGAP domain-containing protein [Ditylenchus destructor]
MNAFTTSAAALLSRYTNNLLKDQCEEALSGKIRGEESTSSFLFHSAIQIMDSFKKDDFLCVGLHRINGSVVAQQKAMEILEHALGSELKIMMIHDLNAEDKAGCLRMVLRKLPDTLFPRCQRDALLDIAESVGISESGDEIALKALKILVYFIPEAPQRCLKKLLGHLNQIATMSDINKMGIENLGIMFTSTIFPVLEANDSMEDIKADLTLLSKLFPIVLNYSHNLLFCLPDELIDTFCETSKLETSISQENSFKGCATPIRAFEEPEVVMLESCSRRSTPTKQTTDLESAKLMADIYNMPEGPRKVQLLKRIKRQQRQQLGLPKKQSVLRKVFRPMQK